MRVETKIARRVFALFLGFFVFALSSAAEAAPKNGRVVQGAGSIESSGTHTDIHQQSDFLATRWDSFNIAAHESVQAHQPSSTARLLIRVDGGGATNIAGSYTSNGITILENQNGVQFSRGAIVNVGGLLATSSRISGVAGANWQLNGVGGAVINHGQIVAGAGGAILAAVKVQNTGDITAKGGDVALGAGSSFTVDFAGSMVGFEVEQAASGASIVNTGKIESQGGIVALSAQEAQAVRTNVVSVGGVVKATKLERRGGVVYLSGGDEGIAEVSGDVQADEKIQTTGEYIVVKDGALLKAPKILVGGDLQGRDGVQTAQRTLVERGALLDAGAKGRVIVWSDETTWFNGDITAPGGFAEVSGKQTLASVNLAGIDVGELLLDPTNITIASTGTTTLGASPNGNIVSSAPGGDLTLAAGEINDYEGDLSLAATGRITVNREINKTSGGLTLIAGGALRLFENINVGTGDLILTGSSIDINGVNTTFTGGAMTITGEINETGANGWNLSFRASGILTLNSNIRVSGSGSFSNINLTGASISLGNSLSIRASGNITLTGAIEGNNSLTLAAARLFLNDNISVGTGNLTLFSTSTSTLRGDVTLAANSISLTISASFRSLEGNGNDLTLTSRGRLSITGNINLGSGILTINAGERISVGLQDDGSNPEFTAAAFNIIFVDPNVRDAATAFTAGGTATLGRVDFSTAPTYSTTVVAGGCTQATCNLGLGTEHLVLEPTLTHAASITINAGAHPLTFSGTGPITIRAPTITITARTIDIGSRAFTIEASTGNLTLNTDITGTGSAAVLLSAPRSDLIFGSAFHFTLGQRPITLMADGSFNFGSAASSITTNGTTGMITLSGLSLPQTEPENVTFSPTPIGVSSNRVFSWFANSETTDCAEQPTNCFITRTDADLTISTDNLSATTSLTIDIGTGVLDFIGSGAITITSRVVNITVGSINIGSRPLTIRATDGALTLGSDIITTGALILSGSSIVLGKTFPLIGSTLTLSGSSVMLTGVVDGTAPPSPDFGDPRAYDLAIMAAGDITINSDISLHENGIGFLILTAGMGEGIGNIITNGTLTLTGGGVDFTQDGAFGSDRLFTFRGDFFELSLTTAADQTVHDWMVEDGPDFVLTSTGGAIMLNRNININGRGVGFLRLSGNKGIVLESNVTLGSSSSVFLTGVVSGNHSLTINTGFLMLNNNINIGTGNLILNAPFDIVLTTDITLTGADITLTGEIDESSFSITSDGQGGNDDLTITASGDLTLNSPISLGFPGTLTLTAGHGSGTGNMMSGDTAPRMEAGSIILTQDDAFAADLFADSSRATSASGRAEIRIGSAANQTIHQWMANMFAGSISSVRGVEGVRLNSITAGRISLAREIDFRAATINLGADISTNGVGGMTLVADIIDLGARIALTALRNGIIDLTGEIDERGTESGDNGSLIISGGELTLNSNINTGTGFITISNNVVLGGNIALSGVTITFNNLISGSAGNRTLTLTATGEISVNHNINLGTGNLTLSGGNIDLRRAATFTAQNVTLTGPINETSANASNNFGLTVIASGALTLNRNINTGAHNLNLTGTSGIVLGGGIILEGAAINITGAVNESAAVPINGKGGNDNLTINASDTLTLNSNINLGSGTLDLTAGTDTGTGNITNGGNTRTLTAGTVSLTQDNAFGDTFAGPTGTFIISTSTLNLTVTLAATDQIVHAWMTSTNRALSITTTGALTIGQNINTGSGNLTLVGNTLNLSGSGARVLEGAAITLTGTITRTGSDALTITAGGALTLNSNINNDTGALTLSGTSIALNENGSAITLTGGAVMLTGAVDGDQDTNDNAFTITATGDITINDNINLGTGNLILTATGANIVDVAGVVPMLTASTVSLTQNGAFAADLFTLAASATSLTLKATGSAINQTAHAWIVAGTNRTLSLTTTGEITVNEDINTGTSALTLSGTSIFLRGGGGTRTLAGSAVTLTGNLDSRVSGAGASANNIIITAGTGNITITGDITASGNVGAVDGVGDGNPGGNGGALTLTANSGSITVDGNLNTNGARGGDGIGSDVFGGNGGNSGAVIINAGGMIQIGNINANGGRGGNATGAGFSGRGGNGGAVDISGSVVMVGLVNAAGGRPGSFDGFGSGESGADGTDGRAMITATGGNLTLGGNINVDRGTITLIAQGTGAAILNDSTQRTLTASTVSLTQVATFGDTVLFTFTTPTLNLTTAASQTLESWMFAMNRSLNLTSTGGNLVIRRSNNNDVFNIGSGTLTLEGSSIVLNENGGNLTLMAGAVVLNSFADGTIGGGDFTITATGNITINSGINLRTGMLTLTAGTSGTGDIVDGTGTPTLTASTVSLAQVSAFGGTPLFMFASGVNELTLRVTAPNTDQAVHDWMVRTETNPDNSRGLSLTTTGAITIGRNIATGSRDLTLDGGTLAFSGAARSLSGENITLTGNATNAAVLTIIAGSRLTLNSNITTTGDASNLAITGGTGGITTAAGVELTSGNDLTISGVVTTAATNGDLTLGAGAAGTLTLGGAINLGTGTATLRAGSDTGLAGSTASLITANVISITFSSLLIGSASQVTAIANNTITFSVTPGYRFGAAGCVGAVTDACIITGEGALVVQPTLTSDVSITITATGSGNVLSFAGDGDITLTAPAITITASSINLGRRMLQFVDDDGAMVMINGGITEAGQIIATGGTLSFVGTQEISGATIDITASLLQTVNSSGTPTAGNLTITATDDLTIGAINIGTGALTLIAGDGGTGDIAAGAATPTLTAGTVNLTQDGAFGDVALFTFDASIGALNLTTGTDQTVHNVWMVVDDRNLSVISTGGAVIVNANINIATGNLNLNGMGGITLGGSGVRRLIGGVITLTGAIDTSSTNIGLFARASGALTLNSDINTGTGVLTLSGTNIFLRGGGGERTLAGGAVTLTGTLDSRVSGDGVAGNNIVITAGTGDITITGSIITSGNGGELLSGNGGDLTLTANSGNIMITGSITATGGDGMFSTISGNGSEVGGNGGSLIFTATGNITVGGNINLDAEQGEDNDDGSSGLGGNGGNGGGLTLTTTGGNITLTGSVNANGGVGGRVTNTEGGGVGGAGGVITLEGDSVMVGLINARSGSGGLGGSEGSPGRDGTDGQVMLTASGGNLTLGGNIDVDGGAITLIAEGTAATIGNGGDLRTLTAGTVSLTQVAEFGDTALFTLTTSALTLITNAAQELHAWMVDSAGSRALTLTANGAVLTLNGMIDNGTGDLLLIGTGIALGSNTTLTGRAIMLTGAISAPSGNNALAITATGNITINSAINLGMGALTLAAGVGGGVGNVVGVGTPTLTASTVSLRQDNVFGNQQFTFVGIGLLELSTDDFEEQSYQTWMRIVGTSLRLITTGGSFIRLPANLDFGSDNLTLSGGALSLSDNTVITGAAITLSGPTDFNLDLTITASGVLTLNTNIDTGSRNLSLTGAGIMMGTNDITLGGNNVEINSFITGTTGALTITVRNKLTLGGDVGISAGNLTLNLGTALATFTGARSLSGSDVVINGDMGIMATGDLTISAGGDLDVNADINVGTNTLRLGAGFADGTDADAGETGVITFMNTGITLRAGNFELTQDGAIFTDPSPATFRIDAGTDDAPDTAVRIFYVGTLLGVDGVTPLEQGTVDWAVGLEDNVIFNSGATFVITAADLVGGRLGALESITLDAGAGNISFASDVPSVVRFTAPTITITANRIALGARTLIITAGGTLTLNVGRFGGSATLTLIAATIAGSVPTVTVPTVSITQDGAFSATAPFTFAAPVIALTLETAVTQDYYSWMRGHADNANFDLSLTSTGAIRIAESAINLGTGNLTLSGTRIVLNHAEGLTIMAEDVALTGTTRGTDRSFTITATGDITLNGSITIGTGALNLDAAGNIVVGSTAPTLTSGNLTLQQTGAFTASLFNIASRASGEVSLSITTAMAQPIHEWMALLGGTNFSLRGDGVTLTSITLPTQLTRSGVIDLQATGIILGGTTTLSGSGVLLTGAIDASGGGHGLTITATGDITLNSDINLGAGALDLTAGMGDTTGDISSGGGGGTRTLTAGTVSLTQDGTRAFGPTDWTIVSNTLTLNTAAAQTVHGWMTASGRNLSLISTGVITITEDAINLGTGNLTLSGASLAAINMAGLTITAGAVELTGVLNTSNAAVGGAPVTITASGALTINNNIVTNLAALTLGGASIVFNRNVRLAGGTITFNGEIDGTACVSCTLRAIGRAGNITFNNNVDFGTGVIVLNAAGGNIASGSTPPIIRSRNLVVRQDGAFSVNLFGEASLITNAVRLFINDAATTQTIHTWLATLSGSVFALGGFDMPLASITTTTAITNSNRIELRAATITLGGVLTSANVSLRTNMIAGMVDIRATTGNIAATNIIAAGAAGTGVPTLATTVTSLTLRQNGAFGAAAPFTFGAEVNALTLETVAAQTYATWMRADDRNLSLTSSGGAITINEAEIDLGTGDLTLDGMGGIAFTNADGLTIMAGAVSLNRAVSATDLPLTIMAQGNVTVGNDITIGAGRLDLRAGLADDATGAISFTSSPTITASRVQLTQDEQFISDRPATFVLPTETEVEGRYIGPDATATAQDWLTARKFSASNVALVGGIERTISTSMNSLDLIRINTGTNALIFDGTLSLVAPRVIIVAGSIELRDGAVVTIIASDGTLRLAVAGTIEGGTGSALSLSGMAFQDLSDALVVNVPTFSLITDDASAFGAAPFSSSSTIGTLNITTRAALTYDATWMRADDRNLSLISTGGAVIVNDNINIGAGDITLNGAQGITLGGSGTRRLIGGAISLTGVIDTSSTNVGLLVNAGGEISIFNNINTGTGNLTLRSATITLRSPRNSTIRLEGGVITLGPNGTALGEIRVRNSPSNDNIDLTVRASSNIVLNSNITLNGSARLELIAGLGDGAAGNIIRTTTAAPTLQVFSILLQQDGVFAADAFIGAFSTIGSRDIRLGSAVEQTIHPWMLELSSSSNFSVRGVDGITLTSITTTGAVEAASGNLDFRAATINLGGDVSAQDGITLQATTINLTAAVIVRSSFNDISLTGTIDTSGTRGNHALEVNAGGVLTLNNNINTGSGALNLTGSGGISLSGDLTLTAATVDLLGVIDASIAAHDLTIVATGDVTISRNINLGTGDLSLTSGSLILRGSGGVNVFTAGAVTLTGVIDESEANFGLTVNASGVLTLNSNMDAGTADFILTGMGGIVLGNNITLAGDEITLTGAIDESGMGGNNNLIIMAGSLDEGLTLNSNINLGTGNLTLNSSRGIALGGNITLTGGVVSLTGAIDESGSTTADNNALTITASGTLTLNSNINTGTGNLTLSGASIATTNTMGLTFTAGAVELTGTLNTSNAVEGGAPVTITASGALTLNNNIVTNLTALTLTAASIVLNRTVRLAGGTIEFNGEIDGTTCGGCTLRAIGRAGNITFNENVDFGTGVIILLATGGNIASGSTPPIMRSRNLVVRQEGAFSADLFSEASLITNAVRLFINDASATQTIHPWLATLSGSVFALGGFNATLTSITTTTAITNSNRIELRAATITLGGVITSANVSLRTNMIAGMVDIRATTGNIAATDIIAAGAAGTGVPTLAPTVTALTLETATALTYATWMRGDAGAVNFNLSLTSTGGALTLNDNINVGTGSLTLDGATITLGGTGRRRLLGGAITLTGAIDGSGTNGGLLARASVGDLTINDNINTGTGALTLEATAGSLALGSGVSELRAGSFSFAPDFTCTSSTSPRCITNP